MYPLSVILKITLILPICRQLLFSYTCWEKKLGSPAHVVATVNFLHDRQLRYSLIFHSLNSVSTDQSREPLTNFMLPYRDKFGEVT